MIALWIQEIGYYFAGVFVGSFTTWYALRVREKNSEEKLYATNG